LKEFGITVDTSKRRLAEYSYDASNYRIPPLGIVFPRSAQEIVMVMKVCHQHQIPVTSRGGGTSMAGNAVGRGLVLDLSRHLNKVLRIDLI
ncbi:FAD-binding protein, partial [Ferrimicrobium sp.]